MLPDMQGRQIPNAVRDVAPDLPFLFMSGFAGADLEARELLDRQSAFLSKPFSTDMLARRVRELIDRRTTAE